MERIDIKIGGWKLTFMLEDHASKDSPTPNLRVAGFSIEADPMSSSSVFGPVLGGLMPHLHRFPMLHAIAIIFGNYEELSLAMSPYCPLPFHPSILNHQYVLVIERRNNRWLKLDFPEVVPLPPRDKSDYIGINPITLLPTGMSPRNTSNVILLISYYVDRSDLERKGGHYALVARDPRPLSIMVALSPPNIHEPRDRVLPQ